MGVIWCYVQRASNLLYVHLLADDLDSEQSSLSLAVIQGLPWLAWLLAQCGDETRMPIFNCTP